MDLVQDGGGEVGGGGRKPKLVLPRVEFSEFKPNSTGKLIEQT